MHAGLQRRHDSGDPFMTQPVWWRTAVTYQIYPRSFADSDGDGIGDLPGIIDKLDYLQWLGIDAIWLSPHYPSPQVDCGYDVADYTAVNPEYGTLDDFRRLLDEAHARGIRMVIDVVLNHTSDQHGWFQESRSGRDNPNRDWYIWRDGVDGGPPNNWQSTFGGSAWEYDAATDQYYYHYFLKEQPDLNWRNPEVKAAVFDAMRFWLDMGVDGFRMDAIGTVFEREDMPAHQSDRTAFDVLRSFWLAKEHKLDAEATHNLYHELFGHQLDQPEIHDMLRDFRTLVDGYEDRFLIGEAEDLTYLGNGDDELHAVFNFDQIRDDTLVPANIRASIRRRLAAIPPGAWFSNTLNNHDQSRLISHYGDGVNDGGIARAAAAMVLLLEGAPYLYYGEEIGMTDYAVQSYDEVRDLVAWVYRDMRREEGVPDAQILDELGTFSRDRCRTPMQWAHAPNAGFSPEGTRTWLPVHPNWAAGVNVAAQKGDPASLLNYYRDLLALRRHYPALQTGTYKAVGDDEAVLAFQRSNDDETLLVLISFSDTPQARDLPDGAGEVVYRSTGQAGPVSGQITLAPYEVLVVQM
jgi:alpha-glucosidase